MSHVEETVLMTESGICIKQKGAKKWTFNPPEGTLFLTDQRVIFAQSGGEFAKRIVVGGLLGGIVGSEMMRMTTKVNKAHLDEALQRPDSFEMHLQDITGVSQKSEFGAKLLMIEARTPGVEHAYLYRQGGLSGMRGFEEWIKDIEAARQRAPSGYQQPPMAQPYQQPPPQYAAPAPIPQAGSGPKFCPNCGQAASSQDKFCQNCGASFQQAPPPQQNACPKCGNQLKPGQRFCNMCGAQVA